MIKRLKWNVLHGSDNDDGAGDLASSASESEAEAAARDLARLVENDPQLRSVVEAQPSSSEEDGDDFLRDEYSEDGGEDEDGFDRLAMIAGIQKGKKKARAKAPRPARGSGEDSSSGEDDAESNELSGDEADAGDQSEEEKFIEWRECNLCPGKRFLHDEEVERHLLSKGHKRALKKFEMREQELREACNAQVADGFDADDEGASDEENNATKSDKTSCSEPKNGSNNDQATSSAAAEKRKLAAKKKLKRMKERKWKRRQELQNGGSDPGNKGDSKSAATEPTEKHEGKVTAPEVEKRQVKKRGKVRKPEVALDKIKVQNAKAMNLLVANRTAGQGQRPQQGKNSSAQKKGPKRKSKKPMSAEKAARKAAKRQEEQARLKTKKRAKDSRDSRPTPSKKRRKEER